MDKLEKKIILSAATLMVLFVVGLVYASTKGLSVPLCVNYDGKYLDPHVEDLGNNNYKVVFVASMWRFEPDNLEIPVGSTVHLYLASKDVVHGFHMVNKELNLMAVPGAILEQKVTFDKPGEYSIVCHEYCGIGHQNMASKIIVK